MNKLGRLIAIPLIGGALALAGCAQEDTTTNASGTPGVFGKVALRSWITKSMSDTSPVEVIEMTFPLVMSNVPG